MSERIFTADEKHRAAMREVGYRKRVYIRLVDAQKMTQKQANEQIAVMEQIAADYQKQAESERLL